jgi:hypothetical protein
MNIKIKIKYQFFNKIKTIKSIKVKLKIKKIKKINKNKLKNNKEI